MWVLSVHLSQGVVTYRSRLEAFANGIKIESSGFWGLIRGSRPTSELLKINNQEYPAAI